MFAMNRQKMFSILVSVFRTFIIGMPFSQTNYFQGNIFSNRDHHEVFKFWLKEFLYQTELVRWYLCNKQAWNGYEEELPYSKIKFTLICVICTLHNDEKLIAIPSEIDFKSKFLLVNQFEVCSENVKQAVMIFSMSKFRKLITICGFRFTIIVWNSYYESHSKEKCSSRKIQLDSYQLMC